MTDQPDTLQTLLQRAIEEHGAGRIAQAEALYREVLSRVPRQPIALYLFGVLALQVGRADMAADLIVQSLVEEPDNAEGHFNLGNAYLALNRSADAESSFKNAIHWQPDYASAHYNLGNLEKDTGRLVDAESSFRAAVHHAPDLAQAWCNLGLVLDLQGRREEAVDAYRAGLRKAPELAEGHSNLGNVLAGLERYDEAYASYRDALAANPLHVMAYRNLGTMLQQDAGTQDAAPPLRRAVLLEPADAENCFNFGSLMQQSGNFELAVRWNRIALCSRPDYPAAYMGVGRALLALKGFSAAADAFKSAAHGEPDNAVAWGNWAVCVQEQGNLNAARDLYRKSLCLAPADPGYLSNCVLVWQSFLELDMAIQLGRRGLTVDPLSTALLAARAGALQVRGYVIEAERRKRAVVCLDPGQTSHYVNLSMARRELCRLPDAERDLRRGLMITPNHTNAMMQLGSLVADLGRTEEAVEIGRQAVQGDPENALAHHSLLFYLHYKPSLSTAEMMADYRHFEQAIAVPFERRRKPHGNRRDPEKRIRIGYVGAAFYRHSSACFFLPLLENHNHVEFEIFCYASYLRDKDSITELMRANADHWVPVLGMSDDALAARIREDEIDILVDLAGHTKNNRLRVFAEKPAPVSFHWLDHGVTTGLSAIDYFLGDPVFTPEDSTDLFAEKIWNLPRTAFAYNPFDWALEETPSPAGLNGYVTFGSTTRTARISGSVLRIWADILHAVPESRFALFTLNCREPTVRQNMIDRFGQLGIGPERLNIGFCTQTRDAYAQIDITLDSFPHNNGVTGFEGLFMGLPTVTLRGKAAIGTLGSSMLTQIGRTEWIAETVEDYLRIACDLASDLSSLPDLRSRVREEMRSSSAMDGAAFARDFEAACRDMWIKWCSEEEAALQSGG